MIWTKCQITFLKYYKIHCMYHIFFILKLYLKLLKGKETANQSKSKIQCKILLLCTKSETIFRPFLIHSRFWRLQCLHSKIPKTSWNINFKWSQDTTVPSSNATAVVVMQKKKFIYQLSWAIHYNNMSPKKESHEPMEFFSYLCFVLKWNVNSWYFVPLQNYDCMNINLMLGLAKKL